MVETFKTLSIGQQERLSAEYADAMTELEARTKERDDLREALRYLAYTISPNLKALEPEWHPASYEPAFALPMEQARKALAGVSD